MISSGYAAGVVPQPKATGLNSIEVFFYHLCQPITTKSTDLIHLLFMSQKSKCINIEIKTIKQT